jgi:hypothetical protein
MGFETKEGETEKELVQRLNIELLQGQMRLRAKVIAATWQRLVTTRASTSTAGTHPGAVLLKFATSEDRQAALRRCKGLARTKLGLDEDLTPAQQARKSELWLLFKEAKAVGKRAFWRAAELFINDIQIFLPSSIYGCGDQRDLCVVLWNMHRGGVNKLETGVQILKMFQGANFVLLTKTWHFPNQQLPHVEGFDSLAVARIVQLGRTKAIKHSGGVGAYFRSHLSLNLL